MSQEMDKTKSYSTKDPSLLYIAKHSLRLSEPQRKLIELTLTVPRAGMLGSTDEMQFLANLVRAIGAKKTLDIGVFTGYSALTVAMALPADGRVVAMDVSDENVNLGKPFWKEAGVYDKIDLRIAPAKQTLESLVAGGESGTYDFSFIDADKSGYDAYYELSLTLLRPGGIIAIDNVLWSGKVHDDTVNDPDTVAIRALNKKVHADQRVDVSMLSVGDGVTLAFKR